MHAVSIFQYAVPYHRLGHMHSPLPELLKPEGCNLLLLGFMARYASWKGGSYEPNELPLDPPLPTHIMGLDHR